MRLRPKVEIRFHPTPVRPGESLEVDATFISRTRTPVDAIDFTLRGVETFVTGAGKYRHVYRAEHYALTARATPQRFTPGNNLCRVRFAIPAYVPNSYAGTRGRIDHELSVHVAIPWWLDVDHRYLVPVVPPPRTATSPRPGVFCSDAAGPRGFDLYAEATLDDVITHPGDAVTGAVSLAHVRHHTIRRVRVAFVAIERLTAPGAFPYEARRYEAIIAGGNPAEGAALPFSVAVPADAPPAFTGKLSTVEWRLEISVDTPWKRVALLAIPIQVLAPPVASPTPAPTRTALPAIGRARRDAMWTEIATRHGLTYDAERERMDGSDGDVTLSLAFDPTQQVNVTLAWPSLGMDLEVAPARWSDRFSQDEIETGDAPFDAAFRVRGRVHHQVLHLLTAPVRALLLPMRDVRVHDEGVTFSVASNGTSEPVVMNATAHARDLARALRDAMAQLPEPAPLRDHVSAWREAAARWNGRYEPGRCWIHGGTYGMAVVDVGTQWSHEGEFESTLVRVHLDPPLDRAYDPDDANLTASARSLVNELRALTPTMDLGPDAIAAELATLTPDPRTLEPLLETLARLGRALQGREDLGPYR